jgi:serine/threonine protein phosphatase PrpC
MAGNVFDHLSSAELTDIGHCRKNNEDAVLRLPERGVFCVADGMGGVQGGEVASKAVVDALRKEFSESSEAAASGRVGSAAKGAERAINAASLWIKERAEGLGLEGTGSTVVVLVFDPTTPSRAVVLHAGDSRAYRCRGDELIQLMTDHSVAAAAGLRDDRDLPAMYRGVITRAVGLDRHVRLESTEVEVAPGDLFLLCSDGLDKMLSDHQIHEFLRCHHDEDLQDMAKALIAAALGEGGEDNVSVVLVRVAKTAVGVDFPLSAAPAFAWLPSGGWTVWLGVALALGAGLWALMRQGYLRVD